MITIFCSFLTSQHSTPITQAREGHFSLFCHKLAQEIWQEIWHKTKVIYSTKVNTNQRYRVDASCRKGETEWTCDFQLFRSLNHTAVHFIRRKDVSHAWELKVIILILFGLYLMKIPREFVYVYSFLVFLYDYLEHMVIKLAWQIDRR